MAFQCTRITVGCGVACVQMAVPTAGHSPVPLWGSWPTGLFSLLSTGCSVGPGSLLSPAHGWLLSFFRAQLSVTISEHPESSLFLQGRLTFLTLLLLFSITLHMFYFFLSGKFYTICSYLLYIFTYSFSVSLLEYKLHEDTELAVLFGIAPSAALEYIAYSPTVTVERGDNWTQVPSHYEVFHYLGPSQFVHPCQPAASHMDQLCTAHQASCPCLSKSLFLSL